MTCRIFTVWATRAQRVALGLAAGAALLASVAVVDPAHAGNPRPPVVLAMPGASLPQDQLGLLPTYFLPGANNRYGLEYRASTRELLARPDRPMVCFQSGGIGQPSVVPTVYLDPNGIRYTVALETITVGGHPYRPYKFGSVALTSIQAMAYEVDASEFFVGLQAGAGVTCVEINRQPTPLTPATAICGGGLTDDPKDGWTDNSVFRGGFDEDVAQAPPDLELIPWREPATPVNTFRYGYLVRNNGATTAQGVKLREFAAGDAARFQRSVNVDGSWTCLGYGGAKCDAWPSMLYDQGYMATNSGTIPPGGCLKFEAFRDFTFNPVGDFQSVSGVVGASVISDDEPAHLQFDNQARMNF